MTVGSRAECGRMHRVCQSAGTQGAGVAGESHELLYIERARSRGDGVARLLVARDCPHSGGHCPRLRTFSRKRMIVNSGDAPERRVELSAITASRASAGIRSGGQRRGRSDSRDASVVPRRAHRGSDAGDRHCAACGRGASCEGPRTTPASWSGQVVSATESRANATASTSARRSRPVAGIALGRCSRRTGAISGVKECRVRDVVPTERVTGQLADATRPTVSLAGAAATSRVRLQGGSRELRKGRRVRG